MALPKNIFLLNRHLSTRQLKATNNFGLVHIYILKKCQDLKDMNILDFFALLFY